MARAYKRTKLAPSRTVVVVVSAPKEAVVIIAVVVVVVVVMVVKAGILPQRRVSREEGGRGVTLGA